MNYYIFSTLSTEADKFLNDTLIKVSTNEIDIRTALENLVKVESYDTNGKPYFEDADLVKETKYDFVSNLSEITKEDEDSIWDIYDSLFE